MTKPPGERFVFAVGVTADLYVLRQHTRDLLGTQYAVVVGELAALLKTVAEESGEGYLESMMKLAAETHGAGRMAAMSAYVELAECEGKPELLQQLLRERRTA